MINAALVRWAGGWHEVVDTAGVAAAGRREALLSLGAIASVAEAERVAARQLGFFAAPRVDIGADLRPQGDSDTPYLAFGVGDTVEVPALGGGATPQRLRALTVAEDADGVLSFAPELADPIRTRAERLAESLKKMADGTARGAAGQVATPTGRITFETGKDCCPPRPAATGWTLTFTATDVSFDGTALVQLEANPATLVGITGDFTFDADDAATVDLNISPEETSFFRSSESTTDDPAYWAGWGGWDESSVFHGLTGAVHLDDTNQGVYPFDAGWESTQTDPPFHPPLTLNGATGPYWVNVWVQPSIAAPWSGALVLTFDGDGDDLEVALT